MVFIGRSKFDVEDTNCYEYLEPMWKILENTSEKGITTEELLKQSGLEEKKTNELVQEIMMVFQRALLKEMKNPFNLFKMNNSKWFEKNLANSWVFDKMMLLATRVDTGNPDDPMDGNPFMSGWKEQWLEKRGM